MSEKKSGMFSKIKSFFVDCKNEIKKIVIEMIKAFDFKALEEVKENA